MAAATTYFVKEDTKTPIHIQTSLNVNESYAESPTSMSKPFEMAEDTHSRHSTSDPTVIGRVSDAGSVGNASFKGSSRSSSPLVGPDRKALFSNTIQTSSPLANDTGTGIRGQLLPQSNSRLRSRSFTEKAVDTLAVPVSFSLIFLCLSWYTTSVVSNTLNKTILTVFPYPVTLTMIQFFMAVSLGIGTIHLSQISRTFYRLLPAGTVSLSGFRYPTKEIVMSTLPMGVFQLFGHIFSHMATSLIPVSLVHTIKALSPLFTVAAYRFIFGVKYPMRTYWTLIPLTTGVILTCSTQFSSQMRGIFYALTGALIFVSQNIYSKKLLTYRSESSTIGNDKTPRIDKLNILCYSSSMAFILTSPLWMFSEGFTIIGDYINDRGAFGDIEVESQDPATPVFSIGYIAGAFLMNGISHFLQNIIAFQVLGMVSPVTYSVASLIKRIAVVTVSILWFNQKVSGMQQFGIVLTFGGLYIYDKLGGDKVKPKKYTNISLQQVPSLPK